MNNTTQLTQGESKINIGISKDKRAKVVEILTVLLADEHVLYLKLRNYHWNVEGMFFAPLHSLFEEQYDKLAGSIDDIAERIRSLGYYASGSMEAFKQMARLSETDHLNGDAKKMLQNLLVDHEMIIKVLRNDVEETQDQYKDAGTADFLTALMEMHEKMAWMLRSHLA
jgi:starvation-inducible DNA-binding protein